MRHKGRFFNGAGSKGGTSLELHDLVMQNGEELQNGGAIQIFDGALVIYHSIFQNNAVPGGLVSCLLLPQHSFICQQNQQ